MKKIYPIVIAAVLGVGMIACTGDRTSTVTEDTRGLDTSTDTGPRECSLLNGQGIEVGNACELTQCYEGFDNCDDNGRNGCEVILDTSTLHCGACNNACEDGESCENGLCTCGSTGAVCGSDQSCCNGACAASNDPSCGGGCGGNGTTCGDNERCCGDSCQDILSSTQNCGGCGLNCVPDNQLCTDGACVCAQGFEDVDGDSANGCESAIVDPPKSRVTLERNRLLVNGELFPLRGVLWHPVPRGGGHPQDIDFRGFVEQDSELMVAGGFNVIRTPEPLTDRDVLDALYERGIYVINTVYAFGGEPAGAVQERVAAVGDHPAMLMWLIGDQWNNNGLYVGLSPEESQVRLKEVAGIIREAGSTLPIATIHFEFPDETTLASMPEIDVWGIYGVRATSFGTLFDDWAATSEKPMFIADFGADAWNQNDAAEDVDSQSRGVTALASEIKENRVDNGGVALGGVVLELTDSWWKAGNPEGQDTEGYDAGSGPFPDNFFNSEWFGLATIDREARPALDSILTAW